jgi:hypothetical protein
MLRSSPRAGSDAISVLPARLAAHRQPRRRDPLGAGPKSALPAGTSIRGHLAAGRHSRALRCANDGACGCAPRPSRGSGSRCRRLAEGRPANRARRRSPRAHRIGGGGREPTPGTIDGHERARSGRQTAAALAAPPTDHGATRARAHPEAEAVLLLPLAVVRLKRPLHAWPPRMRPRHRDRGSGSSGAGAQPELQPRRAQADPGECTASRAPTAIHPHPAIAA